ncbi:MAG: vWA domain-containing protein [Thermoguttaceae bacterium]
MMWPELANTLTWWQWTILAAVPPAIIALYFLKLKRKPVEVPSTYLWRRSIEDLHVNTVWQRLRRNLLMFLQLAVIGLVMLAVLQPGWRSRKLPGHRFIFLIDNSASMQATDVAPSRLEEAKRQALETIAAMAPGDVAMVIAFSDAADVKQSFTENAGRLRRAVEAIQPTQRTTSLLEALKVASGLANPGRSGTDPTDVQVAEALPARLFLYSDGKFDDAAGFSLGNLDAEYRPIGTPEAANVGIVAMNVRRHETKTDQLQAFARLQNFGKEQASISVELLLNDNPDPVDVARCTIDPGETHGLAFDLGSLPEGVLHLRMKTGDHLALDDEAWVAISPLRHANVLLVTPGNPELERNMGTSPVEEIAQVTVQSPAFLTKETYQQQASAGAYDLVIYDRCRPKEMPQANTFFLGSLPSGDAWKAKPKSDRLHIIDTDSAHPMMQWIDLGNVEIAAATPLELPPGGRTLIDSTAGPLLVIAPREGFEDAVLGFVLIDDLPGGDGKKGRYIGTNWFIRPSFPIFVYNMLSYLGGSRSAIGRESIRPGQQVVLENPNPEKPLTVHAPDGRSIQLKEGRQGKCVFSDTGNLGIYDVQSAGKTVERFAVNLFQPAESDISARPEIKIGRVEVQGESAPQSVRRDLWKILLLAGLAVSLLEWYIYNRRIHW